MKTCSTCKHLKESDDVFVCSKIYNETDIITHFDQDGNEIEAHFIVLASDKFGCIFHEEKE